MERKKAEQYPTWLNILFVLATALLFTALYEMLWALVFAGNCCRVSAWYDMPSAIILALALTSAYILRRSLFSHSYMQRGLWLLIGVLLVEIPVKEYLGENQTSGLLAWYPIFPALYLASVGLMAASLKRLRSLLPFVIWGAFLAIGTVTFVAQKSLIFSGWGVGFEVMLLVFQAWLVGAQMTMIHRKEVS